MIFLLMLYTLVGQIMSWIWSLIFILDPSSVSKEYRTKRTLLILLIPFGFNYFVWIGMKQFSAFVLKQFRSLD